MCPLRCIVSGLHIGFTQAPDTQAPLDAHLLVQLPQWFWSLCMSKQPSEQTIPVKHMHVPLLQVCPAPHVTLAHGSVMLPPVLLVVPAVPPVAPPAELVAPLPPVVEPPVELLPATPLTPPLVNGPPPLDVDEPP